MDAAEIIRAARHRGGLTQAEFALAAAVTQPVISAYENGRRQPGLPMLRHLVEAAGARLDLSIVGLASDLRPPVDDLERSARLLDVLLLADAVGHRPRGPLDMPRMVSRSESRVVSG